MMVNVKPPRRVSGELQAVKPSEFDDELNRRVIINFGRSVGASHLATQVLLQGAANDPQLRQDLLMGIDDQLRNLSLVLDNLVQFSVLQRGALVLDLKTIDLQRWLPRLLGKWQSVAARRGLDWREHQVPGPMPVRVDADRLAQVMSNLLSNATQYTPENGTVIVISGSTATDAWIRIDNSGPGLTANERQRVFEPFFASANQGAFPKGVGLGLAVAEWLVRAQNGRLEFESEVGQGCSFTVWLPLENHAAESE